MTEWKRLTILGVVSILRKQNAINWRPARLRRSGGLKGVDVYA